MRAMSAKETFVTTTAPETLKKLQNGSDACAGWRWRVSKASP